MVYGERRHHLAGRPGSALRASVVLVLLVGATLVGPAGEATAAPTLPPSFVVQDVPSGQDALLTDVAFAPDGSWFTTGKTGRVAWVAADGQARTLATLDVVTNGDLGLTSLAVARDYASSRVLYTFRTLAVGGQSMMRLSAWTVQGSPSPTALSDERVIWDLPATGMSHSTGGLVVDQDGTLWLSIGDSAGYDTVDPLALRALDTTVGYGKVLHVRPDGSGVSDNPFYDRAAPSSWQSRVYASGFRSPFRLSLDPRTGEPLVGDVGWNSWEEVDLVHRGGSYGWPCWEGRSATPGYTALAACSGVADTDPLWTYAHGPPGSCVIGGIVYTGGTYPAEYRGAYFFGDYISQRVYTMEFDENGQVVREPEPAGFGAGNGAPAAFVTAPNGDIVYADIAGSTLKRLVYAGG